MLTDVFKLHVFKFYQIVNISIIICAANPIEYDTDSTLT